MSSLRGRRKKGKGRGEGEIPLPFSLPPPPISLSTRVFCVTSMGGLYLEGLIFGILRHESPAPSAPVEIVTRACVFHSLYYL